MERTFSETIAPLHQTHPGWLSTYVHSSVIGISLLLLLLSYVCLFVLLRLLVLFNFVLNLQPATHIMARRG